MDQATSITALRGLKIVFVFGNLELGGAERQGLLLAEYLKRECGAEVQVVGLGPSRGRVSELCDQLGIRSRGVRFHWGLLRRLPSFFRAVRVLREARPDILVSYTRVPNMVCALGWSETGAKLCVWNQADEGLLMNWLPHYRLAVSRAHCFISNSSGGRDFLVKTYGKSPEEIQVIYNGIPAGVPAKGRAEWRKELQVEEDALAVCMIANLSAYKDHATLVKAWKKVLERGSFGKSPVLVLGGRFDGEEKEIARLADELGIRDSIRLPGKIDDVPGLLRSVDLFAYSSKSEGIPNAVLEAMAAGLPVVGTDIPGIREAVGAEGSPYLAGIGKSGALAEKIVALLEDANLRSTVGRALQKRIEEKFSLEVMCRETAELLARFYEKMARS